MEFFRVLKLFSFLVIAFTMIPSLYADELDPEPQVYFVKVNPRGTYLSPPKCYPGDPPSCDTYQPPSRFSLLPLMQNEDIQLKAGDLISLEAIGGIDYDGNCNQQTGEGCNFVDEPYGILGVFHGSSGFLFPGPESTTSGVIGLWADIPQDFQIGNPPALAQVPEGATEILFSPDDEFFKDNIDPNGDYGVLIKLTVMSCIYKLDVELSEKEVIPSDTRRFGAVGKEFTMVDVTLSCANDPNPKPELLANKTIHFLSKAKEKSGGHDHVGNRPTGEFEEDTCVTDSSGKCSSPVKYTPSKFGGIEEIYAGMDGKVETVNDMKELTVKVPGLIEFPSYYLWDLVGGTNNHKLSHNHFIKPEVAPLVVHLAYEFVEVYGAKLQINDMSLPYGGLFDIGGKYGLLWHTPHKSHRIGRSVDVNHCAKNISGQESGFSRDYLIWSKKEKKYIRHTCDPHFIAVTQDMLKEVCAHQQGKLVEEENNHCEFGGI